MQLMTSGLRRSLHADCRGRCRWNFRNIEEV